MTQTINQTMTWPGLTKDCKAHTKVCKTCQRYKKQRRKYSYLPAKEAEVKPWRAVCVDLIGPYTVDTLNGEIKLLTMTMIDPATSWFEIALVLFNKSSAAASGIFNNNWLCRYPQPKKIIYNNGSKFKKDFKQLCKDFGLKSKPTTVRNPQANVILECVHQVVGNMLCT